MHIHLCAGELWPGLQHCRWNRQSPHSGWSRNFHHQDYPRRCSCYGREAWVSSSCPHLVFFLSSSPVLSRPLSSNLPTLSLNTLHQRVARLPGLRRRQSFYSPLPPGSLCFLKVMVHCKSTKDWKMHTKNCLIECFFVYFEDFWLHRGCFFSCLLLKIVHGIGSKILPSPGWTIACCAWTMWTCLKWFTAEQLRP